MFPSFFLTQGTRARLVLISSLFIGILLLTAAVFPFVSGAKSKQTLQPSPIQQPTKASKLPFKAGEVIVRYRSESTAKNKMGAMQMTTHSGEQFPAQVEDPGISDLVAGVRLVRVAPVDTLKAVAALKRQPDVLYAEPNYIVHASVTPNDPRFGSLPNMTRIGAPQAWNTQQGSRSIVVAVLDQGIDTDHEDLTANIWTNPAPGSVAGITGDVHGYNFVNNNGTLFNNSDKELHATHVAGIIGAVGNNNKGVAGVNWATSIMSLKFLDENGNGENLDAVRALTYAAQMRDLWDNTPGHTKGANLKVINASFGGAGFSKLFFDAITALNTRDILFVAAAGNTTDAETKEPDNDRVPNYPANFNVPNVISVAATDDFDAL